MKFIIFILFILSLIIAPIFVSAECSKTGITVIFVNGIFGDESFAKVDKDLLEKNFKSITKINNVTFINGFNASHGTGAIDLVECVTQAYAGGYLDYDLSNILRQIHGDLKRKMSYW